MLHSVIIKALLFSFLFMAKTIKTPAVKPLLKKMQTLKKQLLKLQEDQGKLFMDFQKVIVKAKKSNTK